MCRRLWARPRNNPRIAARRCLHGRHTLLPGKAQFIAPDLVAGLAGAILICGSLVPLQFGLAD
jgi:hypothetical protein